MHYVSLVHHIQTECQLLYDYLDLMFPQRILKATSYQVVQIPSIHEVLDDNVLVLIGDELNQNRAGVRFCHP